MVENEGPAEVCIIISSTELIRQRVEVITNAVMKGIDNPAAGIHINCFILHTN